MTTLRLTLFEAGACRSPGFLVARGGGLRPQRFPALVALIEHPEAGPVLFDTGYAPRIFDATRRLPFAAYRWMTPMKVAPAETAAARLAARGHAPGDVRLLVLSHFHADHLGGLLDFPGVPVVGTAEGREAVRGLDGRAALQKGFIPALVPSDLDARARWLRDDERRPIPPEWGVGGAGWNVLGDGSLWGLPLPGHAEGQMGLLLQSERGPVFLVADAVWTSRTLAEGAMPHRLARAITADPAAWRRTAGWLRELRHRRPDLRMIPSHCGPAIAAFAREAPPDRA